MKLFLRIFAIVAAVFAAVTIAGMVTRIFRTKMTRYYKVY